MLNYKAVEIFTSEEARHRGKPVADAVVQYIKGLQIAARCIVTRGIAGCYESGEVATGRLEIFSINMPIRITIVSPSAEIDLVMDGLDGMIHDGIVAVHDLHVLSHRARNAFFPRQLMVRDVMTVKPQYVRTDTPLGDVVKLLLPSMFGGLPVLDKRQQPVGMITQGDLIRKGGLPLRLGLLSESDEGRLEAVLHPLASQQAIEVMTTPVVTIAENRPLAEAVDRMLEREVKRLPVVNDRGQLSGMLARLDIFRTVMREAPDWSAFSEQKIEVSDIKRVGDVLRRDTHTVFPETPIEDVIRLIDSNDVQRVAVVDSEGKLLGLIADLDLLRYFKSGEKGIWHRLAEKKRSLERDGSQDHLQRQLAETPVGKVMTTDLITVREEMRIEEAIGLMTEKGLKRLPVVDDSGRFRGMISRDSLLRIGFHGLPS